MADFSYSPQAGEPAYESDAQFAVRPASNTLTTLTNVAGALVSCALIVGIGVWGYKLLVRDVSGIPVVRAAEGDMRVRPDDPGGLLAQHQGLSVNAVAAEGAAARAADELRLAPQPVEISAEDTAASSERVATAPQELQAAVEAAEETATSVAADVAAALESGEVEDLVAQLTAGVTPLSELPEQVENVAAEVVAVVTPAATTAVQEAATEVVAAVLDAPGVRQSLRPRKRPVAAAATVVPASLTTQTPTIQQTTDVDAASIPAGTRLAQLGAFDSEEVAREQWDQMNIQFGAYLSDKQRIIQRATSGGRVFYRLRAMGFEDIADARRFCSALVAENADCIPVVTR